MDMEAGDQQDRNMSVTDSDAARWRDWYTYWQWQHADKTKKRPILKATQLTRQRHKCDTDDTARWQDKHVSDSVS